MKLHRSLPSVVAFLITAVALSLIAYTAVSRQGAAKARRLAAETAARDVPRQPDEDAGASRVLTRQPLGAAEHDSSLEKRLHAALSIGHAFERTRALLALMKEFTPGDFRLALDLHQRLFNGEEGQDFESLLGEWTRRDPKAALEYVRDDITRMRSVFWNWTQFDEPAALRWALEEAHDPERADFIGLVLSGMAHRDPALVLEHLDALSPEDRRRSLQPILYLGGADSAAAVVKWIGEMEDPAERTAAVRMVFACWRNDSAQEKFDLLMNNPDAMEGIDLGGPFQNWSDDDPVAARAALDQLPAGPPRHGAVQQMVLHLIADGHVEEAAEIRANYPLDDRTLQDGIVALSDDDPAKAVSQAHLIRDPFTRDQAYSIVLGSWMRQDPAAAREWMSSNELPDDLRKRMEIRYAAAAKNAGK